MTNYNPSVERWINIGLTVVIAVAAIAQAWFTHKQEQLLEQSQKLALDRDKPRVRIVPSSHSMAPLKPYGNATTTSFEGFIVTNTGFVDIEITSFKFEVGRMRNSGEDDSPTAMIEFVPVVQHNQTTISTISLPHRLRHGESFKVLYDRAQLVEESIRLGGESPVHMRPFCRDSLGNKHMPDHWIAYREGNSTYYAEGPSPGRISEEHWNRLEPVDKKRYSRWSQKLVGG